MLPSDTTVSQCRDTRGRIRSHFISWVTIFQCHWLKLFVSYVVTDVQFSVDIWYALEFVGDPLLKPYTFLVYHIIHEKHPEKNTLLCFNNAVCNEELHDRLSGAIQNDQGGILSDPFAPHILFLRDHLTIWSRHQAVMNEALSLEVCIPRRCNLHYRF